MKFYSKDFIFSITATLCCLLYACGGGGGNQVGGIDRSGAPVTSTSGPISGFGSVIVNGVRYHSDKATILVNDFAATESDLHAGFQVHVSGTLNTDGTGDATVIEFFPHIVGLISAIDTRASQLTVLGQTIRITNSTLFSANINPNFIDGLKIGDKVQISGQFNNQAVLIATRIDLITTNTTMQLLGSISNVDTSNFTFNINNLVVNYSAATMKNVSGNILKNGARVFITGSLNNSGVFAALTIKELENTVRSGSDHAEVEGFISRFVSATDFDIAGVACTTNSSTTFNNGTAATLALGVEVEAVGAADTAGKVTISKLQFHQHDNQALAGLVTSISTNTSGAIVTGTLQVSGVTVQTNALTRLEDKSASELKRFNVSDIHNNEFVKVSGYNSDSGFIATQIERRELHASESLRLEGRVTSSHPETFTFTINDRSIIVADGAQLRDANGITLNRIGFFALTLVGHSIEVRGTLNNGIFSASEAELKND